MPKWEARDVKCPFFRGLTEQQISCEGVTKKTILRIDFREREDRRIYQSTYCNAIKNYDHCRVARLLMQKYGEE